MKYILSIFLLILPLTAFSAEYKISEFDPITDLDRQFLELYISEDGRSFAEILKTIFFRIDDLDIRILGNLPKQTKVELMTSYEEDIPEDLTKALKTNGDMHHPELSPLSERFSIAFKRTGMYLEIENALKSSDYRVLEINHEKLSIIENQISVPDIWLRFKKVPNKANP